MPTKKVIKVMQDPENEVPAEIIAQSIVDIAAAMKKLSQTRLNRDAIVTLVARSTGLPRSDVNTVLIGLEGLERAYLKPK